MFHASQRSLSDILASADNEPFRPFYLPVNRYYNCYCDSCSMDKGYDKFINSSDRVPDSPFMFQLSSSTLLLISQASSPSPMDQVLPVKVDNFDQLDDHYFENCGLFNDFTLESEFIVDGGDENEINENVKENISVESLLLNGLTCSQLSKDGGDSLIRSQSLSQSQRSQNSLQKSQENSNVLQVKSLDNSILSSSYENYSQPLVIASQSSYHGPSSFYNSSSNYTSNLTQSDSQLSQQSQEGNCCRKHKKYFEKLANKPEKRIDPDFALDVDSLYTSTHNGYLKPPFSHNMSHICALAIYSEPTRQQEVSGVYKFLMECFPYFQDAGQHWKNSLRHSLATCDWFEKSDHPRTAKKGYKYTVTANRMNCLKYEIKKQCITDITKLHYRLSGLCKHDNSLIL
ncbi:forkhead box protein N4-like [Panonychus citri]|uniref:forkhead box protein N4-like n=1 Tax=Panonychus citri TaxID=50023 RepID=UPI0023075DA1|nr:forkhead box protein N4-like [Panonychus citri]XP_053203554.1 forkhead box protein N4-like [Panonychus citri]XP_053203813.1 forkhead box protein N4-like [Panonychus citri]